MKSFIPSQAFHCGPGKVAIPGQVLPAHSPATAAQSAVAGHTVDLSGAATRRRRCNVDAERELNDALRRQGSVIRMT